MKVCRNLLAAVIAVIALNHTALAADPFASAAAMATDNNLTFVGENDSGNFQLALDDAVAQAQAYFAQMGYSDFLVEYRVRSAAGLAGGIAGFNIIRVTIVLPDSVNDLWHAQP